MRDYDIKHLQNVRAYMRHTKTLFWRSSDRLARLYGELDVAQFDLDALPRIKEAINAELRRLAGQIEQGMVQGIRNEWTLSNNKNDEMLDSILKGRTIPTALDQKYRDRNITGLAGFITRKTDGMALSDRVWQTVRGHSILIEQQMALGVLDGTPATKLATEMKQYLNNPDALFRRVRDNQGVLRLSKAAKDYHPGRGVYRSAYKNALRMTRTETNMSYQKADSLRWQQMDFIKGIEVRRSEVDYDCDICKDNEGEYPKDFEFTAWHPNCMCTAIPILPSEDEFIKNL